MAKRPELTVGVDLGGTSMLAVIADLEGMVLGKAEADTPVVLNDPGPIVEEIGRIVRKAAKKAEVDVADLALLGIGAPGTMDQINGIVSRAVNLGWVDVPLTRLLERETGLAAYAAGDVQAAITGEHSFGAAKDARTAIGIWLGTGLGGGVIIDGELYRGNSGAAGEIGHMVILENGPRCGCGRQGCIEALASRTAIERDIRAALAKGRRSIVLEVMEARNKSRITSGVLAKSLEDGDELVREVLTAVQGHLGIFVANLVNVFDPEVVVIGGGLVEKMGEAFITPIRKTALGQAIRRSKEVRIEASKLGDFAGALGATVVARRRTDKLPQPAGKA